jgi:hypothetical protein
MKNGKEFFGACADLMRATHGAWHLTHTLMTAPEIVTPAMIQLLRDTCHAALRKAKGESIATYVVQGTTEGNLMGVSGIQILCSCSLPQGPQVSSQFRVTTSDGRPVIDVVCPACGKLGRAEFFS